jgi:hypothetical protein
MRIKNTRQIIHRKKEVSLGKDAKFHLAKPTLLSIEPPAHIIMTPSPLLHFGYA